jgi:hypothetical protein
MIPGRESAEFDLEALAAQARRERAEAVYRLLTGTVRNFFRRALRTRRQESYRGAAA